MLVILGVLTLLFITLSLYACCVVASKDSRAIEEEEFRFYCEKNKKN